MPAPTAPSAGAIVTPKYNGGPLWQNGYAWQNIHWGKHFSTPSGTSWAKSVDRAVANMEADRTYSLGLGQYNVGVGRVINPITIIEDPPSRISNEQIQNVLVDWIGNSQVTDLHLTGAYNIFLPPGVSVSLSSDLSCAQFCDYHDTVDGANGPYYTVEPYPCGQGCNQCSGNAFDTLTQGLSEELVELKTDMEPGSGWVIGNLELCDFCDEHFVCNRIATGEYVNAWYDKSKAACWIGRK